MSKNRNNTNSIWLTSRIRMGTESRYRFYDKWLNWAVIYYAVLLVGLNIFGEKIGYISHLSTEVSLFLSVVILALSILVQGSRLGEKASKFRACYLALQSLLVDQEDMTEIKMNQEYQKILQAYPNHSEGDREYFIFKKEYIDKDSIENSTGKITCSKMMIARVLGRITMQYFLFSVLFIFPLALLWYFSWL